MGLRDIYRVLHSSKVEYTVFSSAHGLFSRTDHILDHKTNINKYMKIGIIPIIFPDHKDIKLEVNYKKRQENF